jgi:hypothetical protein
LLYALQAERRPRAVAARPDLTQALVSRAAVFFAGDFLTAFAVFFAAVCFGYAPTQAEEQDLDHELDRRLAQVQPR